MFSVGEFAKKTGLTVRALHFYEERGLLHPARSQDNGRRFYGNTELKEVQKIVSLKQLGFSLSEIETLLRDPRVSLPRVLAAQLETLEKEKSEVESAIKSLKTAIATLSEGNDLDIHTLTNLIRMTTMTEAAKKEMQNIYKNYFSEDQLKELEARKPSSEAEKAYNQEWCELMRKGEALLGSDPKAPEAQALAKQAQGLVAQFTGGNKNIHQNLAHMYSDLDAWGKQLETLMKMDLETFKKVQAFLGQAAAQT